MTFHFSYRKVIRLSLRELDEKCNAQKKNDFLKAWKLIQELPPDNPNSFWSIATYHGMPFKRRQDGDESEEDSSGTGKDEDQKWKTWGGYCQHGNVLFPFWHRLYCLRLEQALQTVLEKGKERVALHYWDASSKESMSEGLPHIVTAEHVHIDGEYVPNPLLKFKLPTPIKDDVPNDAPYSQFYEKEAGYETCRHPYSGIRSPADAKESALAHNEKMDSRNETTLSLLQVNIISWLSEGGNNAGGYGVAEQLKDCLDVTDYNPFSNTSSTENNCYTSVEKPHNGLHLAVGGFTKPETDIDGRVKMDAQGNIICDDPVEGANGDMGANEVASFDPVFFLHHSNIDRMLWVWQKKYKKTNPKTFTINNKDETDKGISNSDQGATPNQTWGQKLNEKTILYPFQDEYGVPRTSSDCIDIVSQLDYDYSIGSLDQAEWPEPEEVNTVSLLDKPSTPWHEIIQKLEEEVKAMAAPGHRQNPTRRQRLRMIFDRTQLTPRSPTGPISDEERECKNFVQVMDINKDKYPGSFLVQVFYKADGKAYYLGQGAVLSRLNRSNCANCQERRMAHVSIPIRGDHSTPYDPQSLEVHFVYKDMMTGEYKRDRYPGKELAGQKQQTPKRTNQGTFARSAPGEQKPSLRIVGAIFH